MNIYQRLESLESEYNAYHTDSDYWRGIKYAIDMLSKYDKGQWIPNEKSLDFPKKCSVCGEGGTQHMKFCFNCGLKMI